MIRLSHNKPSFQDELLFELDYFLHEQKLPYSEDELIKIDLHCHDHNSDVPDELLGRILGVPETWLTTEELIKSLNRNGCDLVTITNHNNARSCYEYQKKGHDILTAAEFSVTVPDYQIGIHVLAYGFDELQEKMLCKLRRNVYQFQQYAKEKNIPTIWAHPLYHYSNSGTPPFDFFQKMLLIFERFEVLNGQRDTWQNMLVKTWLEGVTPQEIDSLANKFALNPSQYCNNVYRKVFAGGSDSHMGIFAGQTGSYLYVPNLRERNKKEPLSVLALDALRKGNVIPYGSHQNAEKLTVAFLDYVMQIALYKKDTGLMRILLHKGSPREKMIALGVSNAFSELRRHKLTMKFVEMFHDCFRGKVPSSAKRFFIPKDYKPVFDEAIQIAYARNKDSKCQAETYFRAINNISDQLNEILFSRLIKKTKKLFEAKDFKNVEFIDIIDKLEISSDLRNIISAETKPLRKKGDNSSPKLSKFLDGLSFPFLASSLILSANFTSAKVLYNNRPVLETFARKIGKLQPPKRMLWLTDTFDDRNGVSNVLQEMHREIKRLNLPIDILVCSNTVKADRNLIVVKPMAEIELPFYKDQTIRFPNFNEVHNLFQHNEYDRIMCSTEGIMGALSLFLKNAYSVPAFFYVHTDWLVFARKVLGLDSSSISRLRRFMRAYYGGFDKLFVLNSDHRKWMTGKDMEFESKDVKLTAHWADSIFYPSKTSKRDVFGIKETDKVLLYAGRLSREKGVFDIAEIFDSLEGYIPNLKLVFAGSGPAEEELKALLPSAIFTGWVDKNKLPSIYSAADLLLLPSRFDTFSCVVLEALSCGLPVVAYKAKGPKDIVEDRVSGYLVSGKKDMMLAVNKFFSDKILQKQLSIAAYSRSQAYSKSKIMNSLLYDVGLSNENKEPFFKENEFDAITAVV